MDVSSVLPRSMPNLLEVATNRQCDVTVNVCPACLSSTGFLCPYPHDSTVVNILDGTVVYITRLKSPDALFR